MTIFWLWQLKCLKIEWTGFWQTNFPSTEICFHALLAGLQIRNANSHDCEKVRSEANSLRFASHKIDLTSLRFRFAIFKMRSLSLRFRNLNRLRIRRAKSAKISLFLGSFFLFFPAQSNWSIIFNPKYSFENNNMLQQQYKSI